MADDTHTETQPSPNLSTEPGKKGMAENAATKTHSTPNISTEHQMEGDARSPSDTLDRGQDHASNSQPVEDVEDRPNVGIVKPEDYPSDRPR